MLSTNQIFNESVQSNLYPFQLQKLTREINDYIHTNEEAESYHFEVCPKCGAIHPRLTKGGTTKAGKQMLRCHECNKRFVVDHGQLTYYSHQSQDKWNDLIIETQEGHSMAKTAALIDVHEVTAFRMRHKYLHMLEQLEHPICTIE